LSLLVGLFDSGLGGLTVLRQVLALYPHTPCLYLGDTARVPYGQRSTEEIRAIASEVVHWLRLQGVGVLVMACNTSNALALDVAVAEAGVPVVGLIDSVAAELGSDRIGVLATPATAASGAYRRAIHACRPSARVLEVGCPAFVPLIEAGDLEVPALREAARGYLGPLLEAGVDTIVLGCTHYPLLRPLLAELLPPDVQLVDPALAAAQRLGPLLANLGDPPEVECEGDPVSPPMERSRYCVTGSAEAFADAAAPWLGARPAVRSVSLQSPARAF
jgi:glutamate racemase